MMRIKIFVLFLLAMVAPAQVAVRGRVTDSSTGRPIAKALIEVAVKDRGLSRATTDASGRFVLHVGGSGVYSLRAEAPGYQAQEISNRTLAGDELLDFHLRPLSDVWESSVYGGMVSEGGQVLTLFGPDIDLSRGVTFPAQSQRVKLPNLRPLGGPAHGTADGAKMPPPDESVLDAMVNRSGDAAVRRIALEDAGQQILLRYLAGSDVPQSLAENERGRQIYLSAQALAPEDRLIQERVLFFEGRAATFQKNYALAEDRLRKALELNPAAGYIQNALGIALLERGELGPAMDAFRRASELSERWAYPRHNLALAQMQAGDYSAAEQSYRTAIELAPYRAYLPYNLGLLYQKENKFDLALVAYRRAIETNPDNADAYNTLGSLYASASRRSEAMTLYRTALQRNPDLLAARHNLALLLAGDPKSADEAVELWRRNLSQAPNFLPSELSLANALAERGSYREALDAYRKVLEARPDYLAARLAAARLHLRMGDGEGALGLLQAAYGAETANPVVFFELLGDVNVVRRRRDEALDAYRKAVAASVEKSDKKRLSGKILALEGRESR